MIEKAGRMDIPDLLEVELETYVILPFQIAKASGERGFNAEGLRQHLGNSAQWARAENIHEPDFIASQGQDDTTLKHIRYQAYNYFHPFVRSFWYDKNLVQRFRHRKLRKLMATFQGARPIVFDAVAELYHFLPDIGVLVLHLKAKEKMSLPQAQDCLDRLRRIYPPYISGQGKFGGHFPDQVDLVDVDGNLLAQFANDQIAGLVEAARQHEEKQASERDLNESHSHILAAHWAALLQPLGTGSDYKVLQLGDDRAALASKINVVTAKGIPLTDCVDRGNMIRLCFADAKGSDRLPYAQRYMAQFEERFCYDRFWYLDGESDDGPSRIMNCGYAFSWLGAADDGYFNNEFDGAPVVFRHIYVPMAIIAHFQKAALLVASRRLSDLSPYGNDGKPKDLSSEEFEALEANFIAFTQTYWFNEITPQEQGIELFDMWRRELRLQELYQEHRQELRDIVAFINGKEEAKQTQSAKSLNYFALVFAVIGVFLAFMGLLTGITGMNELPKEEGALQDMTRNAFEWLVVLMPLWKFLCILVTLVLILLLPIAWGKLVKRSKKSR